MLVRAKVLLVTVLLLYWAISLERVDAYPPLGEDEPWIAAAPYKLATEGVFGSDLFTGYHGMEERHYQHLPAFHLLQAAVFRLAGVGVFQMRFLPITLGLLLLPLSFAVGRQTAGLRVGFVAAVLLCTLRFSGGETTTGIPLLDISRINRYDIGVPVFGLMTLWLFNRAERNGALRWYVASGAAAGLSGLFHLYGLFWLPALGLVLLYRHGPRLHKRPAPYALLAGAVLVWLPWILYVAAGWQDFLGQQRFTADRFALFDYRFYLQNLVNEIDRYRAVDLYDQTGRLRLARPGLWLLLAGLPLSLFVQWRDHRRSPSKTLAIAFVVHVALFALLLKQKHYNYLIAFWPLATIALACGGVWLWRRARWRPLLLALLLLVMVEGSVGIGRRRALAAAVTPYDDYTARIAQHIPSGSRVLGLQHYWLGLRQYPYRTWLLPLFMADSRLFDEDLTLEQALERVGPDIVLVDRHMRRLFNRMASPDDADHERYLQYSRFMERHGAILVGEVDDDDYGRMEVYALRLEARGIPRPVGP